MKKLIQKIKPRYNWEDVILSKPQKQKIEKVTKCIKQRKELTINGIKRAGVIVLFLGEEGTGKTMAAEVIARDLGLDFYKIDVNQIVSKYIGETEKNLRRVFDAAEQSEAILFFDEADALFSKRTKAQSAHNKFVNQGISYLLQLIKNFPGPIILASNFKNNIDRTFIRRFNAIIDFPMPKEKERESGRKTKTIIKK